MSVTIDVNILLYASNASAPECAVASRLMRELADADDLLYLFWPTIIGYLRIATSAAATPEPLTQSAARSNISDLLALPHVRAPGELDGFWGVWTSTTTGQSVRGNLVNDAHIVALMRQHGVGTIWTRDRDFRKFDGIRVKDPFA